MSLSSAVTQAEGDSGTAAFGWTLTLNRDGSTAAYSYSWAVTGVTADAADFGGTFPSGSGTFAAGETSKTITVLAVGDTAVEPAETFTLTVTAAGLNTVTSTGTISNDDAANPTATLAPYTGLVGTRGRIPYLYNGTNKQQMSRTAHYARANGGLSNIGVFLANWYWNPTTQNETSPGAACTYTASVEYPEGTFTRITFAGASSISIANGSGASSDLMPVSIPNGALFWIRLYRVGGGIIYSGTQPGIGLVNSPVNAALGDVMAYGVSGVADMTMGGTIVSGTGGAPDLTSILFPQAVIGTTTRPSIFIDGDSRQYGSGDANDTTGDVGEIARAVGGTFAYYNAGSWGDAFLKATGSNYGKRQVVLQYCSHVVSGRGINALRSASQNKSFATVQPEAQNFWAQFAGKPLFHATIAPVSTSTGDWTTVAAQIPDANAAAIAAFNDYVRTKPSPLAGFFELADVVESARNSGKWKGVTPQLTGDGTHETTDGYKLEAASGVVNSGSFT